MGGDQHARRRQPTPSPRTSAGRATRAPPRQPGYDNQNLPICETLYGQNNAVTAPYYTYRHSDQVIPGESCPIGGSSIAGLSFAFYGGGPYPAEYDGALFFADYTRRCIWAMERGGTTKPSPSNIKGFVGGAANPVDLQIGPDGNLYYVDIGGGTIRRIEYTAGVNQPPVAVATANPTSGDVGMTVSFDGSGSSDPNGDPLSYAWDLDGDGAFDDSTAVKPDLDLQRGRQLPRLAARQRRPRRDGHGRDHDRRRPAEGDDLDADDRPPLGGRTTRSPSRARRPTTRAPRSPPPI